jgi:hypothetical protein
VSQDEGQVNHCGGCGVSLPVRNISLAARHSSPRPQYSWHSIQVSALESLTWLTIPQVCERLDLRPGKVHRLLEERFLLGRKQDGVFRIPELMLDGEEPLGELRGTLVVLLDGGFSESDALEWLFDANEVLQATPIEAMRMGRKTEVRRLAQVLAF